MILCSWISALEETFSQPAAEIDRHMMVEASLKRSGAEPAENVAREPTSMSPESDRVPTTPPHTGVHEA